MPQLRWEPLKVLGRGGTQLGCCLLDILLAINLLRAGGRKRCNSGVVGRDQLESRAGGTGKNEGDQNKENQVEEMYKGAIREVPEGGIMKVGYKLGSFTNSCPL